jgi:hypothetical protein
MTGMKTFSVVSKNPLATLSIQYQELSLSFKPFPALNTGAIEAGI